MKREEADILLYFRIYAISITKKRYNYANQ